MAFFGNWAGARMKLDYSAKLFIMTFLLVTFGAQQDSESKLLLLTMQLAAILTIAASLDQQGRPYQRQSQLADEHPNVPRVQVVFSSW